MERTSIYCATPFLRFAALPADGHENMRVRTISIATSRYGHSRKKLVLAGPNSKVGSISIYFVYNM